MKYTDELNRLVKLHPDAKLIQRVYKTESDKKYVNLMLLPVAGFYYESTGEFVTPYDIINAILIN